MSRHPVERAERHEERACTSEDDGGNKRPHKSAIIIIPTPSPGRTMDLGAERLNDNRYYYMYIKRKGNEWNDLLWTNILSSYNAS
ncbi:hypothetical protein QE152_g25793 [Popillia japonica]|uniref:Uncharacterized protein n=1 Tax=Popillia japonica TaxID=7064 RepID=A0AAW1JZB0_POPJA